MSYGSNWFKGCRDLLQESIDNGTPWDFFVMDIILHRIRFNGNKGEHHIGETFIGTNELADLTGISRQRVRSSLKRLAKKQLVSNQRSTNHGTVIKVLFPSLYKDGRTSQQPASNQPSTTNIDKIRKEKNNIYNVPLVEDPKQENTQTKKAGAKTSVGGNAAHDKVLAYLNELKKGHYKKSLDLQERLKDHTEDECMLVVRHRYHKWKDDPVMHEYIRPQTLFRKTKFEETYLPEALSAQADDLRMQELFGAK